MSEVYQRGSIRRVKRAKGTEVWEWRYRVEEVIALQWDDFDYASKTVTIRRAFTHGEVRETKTEASAAEMPIPDMMVDALATYERTSHWLFPATRGSKDQPRWAGIILEDYIKPVAEKLELPHIGWHTFRHSYRSWLGSGKATLSEQKDLMRHSQIATTINVYGGTPVETMRPHVDAIAEKLKPQSAPTTG